MKSHLWVASVATLAAVAAVGFAGCGSGDLKSDGQPTSESGGSVQNQVPAPVDFGAGRLDAEFEAEFARFTREPLLLTRPMPASGLKVVLQRELALLRNLDDDLKAAGDQRPETEPVALFRAAQLSARLGCSIVHSPPPNQLAAEQREVYEAVLAEQALATLQRTGSILERVPATDPLHEHAIALGGVPQPGAKVSAVRAYCSKTEKYWHDRANELTVDQVEQPRCEAGDAVACWAWSELGGGGSAARERACELGAMIACPSPEDGGPEDAKKSGVYGPKDLAD